jgi:hypothetical protein
MVEVGVAGDEEIGPAVAVHVRDGGAGMPPERDDARPARALGERPVAVVPEEQVVRRRRDEQVGVPVAVEVGGDATLATRRHVETGGLRHVHEVAVDVLEELPHRSAAMLLPLRVLRVGVVVHRVQREPAAVVVIEPAEAAAHHRGRVVRDAEAERALLEVEPDGGGDVRQAVAA